MKIQSINPYTEEVMKEFDYEKTGDIVNKIKRLKENFSWAETDIKNRVECIKKAARLLEKEKRESAELISLEMGKPIRESTTEVERCASLCDYFSDNAEEFLADEVVKTNFAKSYITFEPIGVVLGIEPWNFPFHQAFGFTIPSLLAGNRVALKHSSNVPQCALKIEEILNSALPENVYTNIFLNAEDAQNIIASDYVNGVSFTGSTEIGSSIAGLAGKNIKKTVLELGGSDPFIVLRDADMKKCCATAPGARFRNAGQTCVSAKRFIVEKGTADEFTRNFVESVKSLKMGDPLDKDTDIGPLARTDIRNKLDASVRRSVEMGAKTLTGGKPVKGRGFFYEPTVLTKVNNKMPVLAEEMFGPVAPIIVVENEEEALKEANRTEYGLGASIWSNDIKNAEKLAKKITAGMVYINSATRSDPALPFGGTKRSGYGRKFSRYAFREFVNIKTVAIG